MIYNESLSRYTVSRIFLVFSGITHAIPAFITIHVPRDNGSFRPAVTYTMGHRRRTDTISAGDDVKHTVGGGGAAEKLRLNFLSKRISVQFENKSDYFVYKNGSFFPWKKKEANTLFLFH